MLLNWCTPGGGLNALASLILPLADAGSGIASLTPSLGTGSATFTRATAATTILGNGLVASVASGSPRSLYSPAGLYLGYYAEQLMTNLCLQSENFGATWVAIGTPTQVAAQDTCGVVTLSLVGDADAATLDGYSQAVTFTANAVKAISAYFKAGTSTSTVIRVRDTTGAADRLLVTLTWSGGVPTAAATTGTVLETQALGNNVYRIRMATAAVTAANTNQIEIYPATTSGLAVGNTGNVLVGGVQAEDGTYPTSYIPTVAATVSRNADVLTYPFAGNADATVGTAYAEVTTEWATAGNTSEVIAFSAGALNTLYIGNAAAATTININDGTTTANKTGLTSLFGGTPRKRYSTWGAAGITAGGDGGVTTVAAFDGAMGNLAIGIGCMSSGGNALHGTIKNAKIFKAQFSDAQLASL